VIVHVRGGFKIVLTERPVQINLQAMQSDKQKFKNKLRQFAQDIIQQQITLARKMISNAQEAANSEEKSSAGDKYETARSMGQLDQEMYGQQLAKYVNELALLHATEGILVQCEECSFFIAVGLGRQLIGADTIYFLSPQAPMAKELQQKKPGDRLIFSGKEMIILAIC
jgi:hypothetical protein